jgi:hypothetical protein
MNGFRAILDRLYALIVSTHRLQKILRPQPLPIRVKRENPSRLRGISS